MRKDTRKAVAARAIGPGDDDTVKWKMVYDLKEIEAEDAMASLTGKPRPTGDTSDLVERLRDYECDWDASGRNENIMAEAADALERMGRIENVAIGVLHDKLDEAQATIAAKDVELKEAVHTNLKLWDAIDEWQNLCATLQDEVANLKALLPYHEYKGQDK